MYMRNFICCSKPDKKFLLAFAITLICAIICGIVLYKPVTMNPYLRDFASDYVYNVYNFKNSPLLLTHILSDIVYLYVIFCISYFTKFKYLTLIFVFLRGLFLGIYSVILIGINSFGGLVVAVFVFIPAALISLALCFLVAEFCRGIDRRFCFFVPLALAVADCAVYAVLINALFRVVIIIV